MNIIRIKKVIQHDTQQVVLDPSLKISIILKDYLIQSSSWVSKKDYHQRLNLLAHLVPIFVLIKGMERLKAIFIALFN